MAMLTIEQVAAALARKYWSNKGFFELCSPESYPYSISVSPPNSQLMLKNLGAVRRWQEQYENSPWKKHLVKVTVNHRILGEQRLITKLQFNQPYELEHFIHSFYAKKVKDTMPLESWQDFGGPDQVRRGSFTAFYSLCHLVSVPLHHSLIISSPAFAYRLSGIQQFLSSKAQLAASYGYDFLVAMQFVDFLAALPKTPYLYPRQFALPHMHTKFIEQHYTLLDQLLSCCLPVQRQLCYVEPTYAKTDTVFSKSPATNVIEDTHTENDTNDTNDMNDMNDTNDTEVEAEKEVEVAAETKVSNLCESSTLQVLTPSQEVSSSLDELNGKPWQRFMLRWGFKQKSELVRIRSLDPARIFWLDPQQGFANLSSRQSELYIELNRLDDWGELKELKHIIICENEICYLSLPQISHSIAIWGSGYKAAILGRLNLLRKVDVLYWGDLDTHGFAILNQLRMSLATHNSSMVSTHPPTAGESIGKDADKDTYVSKVTETNEGKVSSEDSETYVGKAVSEDTETYEGKVSSEDIKTYVGKVTSEGESKGIATYVDDDTTQDLAVNSFVENKALGASAGAIYKDSSTYKALSTTSAKPVIEHRVSRDPAINPSLAYSSVRSMLMDGEAIENNLSLKVEEKRPFSGELPFLTAQEQAAYQALLQHVYGQQVRIEQELIPFDQVIAALKILLPQEQVLAPDFYC